MPVREGARWFLIVLMCISNGEPDREYRTIAQVVNAVKKKVTIPVGSELVQFTNTQAGRLQELVEYRRRDPEPGQANAFEKPRYTLEESAFRLLVTEEHLLQKAASESVDLYINVADLQGFWRYKAADGRSLQSTVQTLLSGYLALTTNSCRDLAEKGGSNVTVLELRCPSDPSAMDLEGEIVAALSVWGEGRKFFYLQEPLWVDREKIVLMAPLTAIA